MFRSRLSRLTSPKVEVVINKTETSKSKCPHITSSESEVVSIDFSLSSPVRNLVPREVRRTRHGLPITINTPYGPEPVPTYADTGSDVNIISETTAREFGYQTSDFKPFQEPLKLPGGRLVKPIGELTTSFWFGTLLEPSERLEKISFCVLPGAPAILIGAVLLHQTKTMTEHRHRLVPIRRANNRLSALCSVGKPRMQVLCDVDHILTVALADSGSDIDLVSPQFALDRKLEIYPSEHVIELADGSHIVSYGFIRTSISLGTHLDSADAPHSKVATIVDCFVLEGLSQDVILGEQTLDELRIFTENQHVLVLASDTNEAMELNRIHSRGRLLTWFKKRLNPTSNQIITDGE